MIISVNSHDVLGKLSIVKNYLSVLASDESLSDEQKKLLAPAVESTQFLIDDIKQKAASAKAENHV